MMVGVLVFKILMKKLYVNKKEVIRNETEHLPVSSKDTDRERIYFGGIIIIIIILSFAVWKIEIFDNINKGIKVNANKDLFSIIVSVIWGLGLSTIFRSSCSGSNCVVVKGPNVTDIQNKYFKYDNSGNCYQYYPVFAKCTKDSKPIEDL